MKKIILKSSLEETVGHLMEVALNSNKVSIDFCLNTNRSYGPTLEIKVWDASTYKIVQQKEYLIVDEMDDVIDIEDDTIGIAIAKIDGRYQAAKEMVETNTPKEN
jgi:hypothetical protein